MASRRKKKAFSPAVDVSKIDEASNSELVTLCKMLGHSHASRQLDRDTLIDLILGAPIEIEDPVKDVREQTYAVVEGNRQMMISQMPCDLNCPVCPHDQVVECYSVNNDLLSED